MSTGPTYRNPTPTVDVLIELDDRPGTVVLIERRNPPFGWALPGGFVDLGEWLADAAVREAQEETGLDVELRELFHAYSDPARDLRSHTVSTVFIARAAGAPRGGDDAARAEVFALDALPPLVFDHQTIVDDYAAGADLNANGGCPVGAALCGALFLAAAADEEQGAAQGERGQPTSEADRDHGPGCIKSRADRGR